jgi:peptide/nickel transport system permease protein
MISYICRRVIFSIVVILAATLVIFGSLYLAPGDPITALTAGRPVDQQTRAQLTAQYHLDSPFVVRYGDWLGSVVRGDFGTSYVESEQVTTLMKPRIRTTVLLVTMSSLLIIVVGALSGTLAAVRRGALGTGLVVVEAIALGVPTFVASLLLIAVFSVQLGWFPVFGPGSGAADQVWHMVLPSVALALASVAYIGRITQSAVAVELQRDYVTTATARGLTRRRIIRHHVLRNAAIPVTTASGLIIAYLVVGAAVVETTFSLNGLGSFLVSAIAQNDFPVIQAVSLVVVITFVVINLAVDVICAYLDPRIRLQ